MRPNKRLLTLAAISIMALALIAATACGSDTQDAIPASGGDSGSIVANEDDHNPTTIEPQLVGSEGIPNPADLDTDEVIAVLDGVMDPADGTRLTDDELYPDGEPRPEIDPDTGIIHELLDTDTQTGDDPLTILPVKESPTSGSIDSGGFPNPDNLVNPDNCENALPRPEEPFELQTRTATDSAMVGNPAITAMCIAWYTSDTNENFVSTSLITMDSEEAAMAHYEVLQSQFAEGGVEYDEQRSEHTDRLTATADLGGVGTMVIIRVGPNLVSVHNGPTSDQSEWTTDWMLDLADRLAESL
jgi:hypothetical protein